MKKTAMGISIFAVKDIEAYWHRLEHNLENFLVRYLQNKHEYGTSHMCSERGIQTALAHSAGKIALAQGFDACKTKCICLAVGLCFPAFGSYGMAACEDYSLRNSIPWDEKEIKTGAIEYCIARSGGTVTPQLDEALHAYYENSTTIPEVNVARYCQLKTREIRELIKSGMPANESISTVMDRAAECFSPENSIIVKEDNAVCVPADVQATVDADLDTFIECFGIPKGIFEFLIG